MIKFALIPTYLVEENLEVNVYLKPSSDLIDDYIATYRVYENEDIALNDISNFIHEMTPLLFSEFQLMVNIPVELREMFEL